MSDLAVEVQNLSKVYRLGSIGSRSLRHDLYDWLKNSSIKKNHRSSSEQGAPSHQLIWALNDVSFQVKKGEVMGIIGSNGSGKSTLLKIIARIVEPTKGVVRGKGKISSILEVGTGFHKI